MTAQIFSVSKKDLGRGANDAKAKDESEDEEKGGVK